MGTCNIVIIQKDSVADTRCASPPKTSRDAALDRSINRLLIINYPVVRLRSSPRRDERSPGKTRKSSELSSREHREKERERETQTQESKLNADGITGLTGN